MYDEEDDWDELEAEAEGLGADDGVHALFGNDVDVIVWREHIDALVPEGTELFDLVLRSEHNTLVDFNHNIAIGYWPNGPVVKGVQKYSDGQSVSYPRIPVKPGGELVVVADTVLGGTGLALRVSVEPVDTGESKADKTTPKGPLADLGGNLGIGLAVIIGLGVLYVAVVKP